MASRVQDRRYKYYICGQCKTPIEYCVTDEPPIPCPDCGWVHKERDKKDIPENIKYPIN